MAEDEPTEVGRPVDPLDLVDPVNLDDADRIAAAHRLVPALPGNTTLDRLSALAARLLGTRAAQISLLTDVQHVAAGAGLAPDATARPSPRADSLCTVTARTGEPLVLSDASVDPRVNRLPPVASGNVGSYLGVPLRNEAGHVIGSLCAYDGAARAWEDGDVVVLEELGGAVVAELERVALSTEHQTASARLDLAMEAAGVGSWDWDLASGELSWDDRVVRMFGYEPHEFASTIDGFNKRLHPDDLPRVTLALEETIAGRAPYAEAFRVQLPGGEQRWISAVGRPLLDEHGAVVRIIGAASDVTEQRAAEQEAATSLSLLSLVAQVGRVLVDSLEIEDAVRTVARLTVPGLADWSVVSLVTASGAVEDVECWHRDPELRAQTRTFARHRFAGRTQLQGSLAALASGEPFVLERGGFDYAVRTLRAPEAVEALTALGLESVVVLPLVGSEGVIGLLTLARDGQRPPMTAAELATAKEIAWRAGAALDNARSYSRIREMSEQLQRAMLTEPSQPEGMRIAVRYTPAAQAAQVGGDWYDAFQQPDGSVMLVVGDVIGHDTAAAAAMGQLRSLTRGIAYSTGEDPAGVLSRVSAAMAGLGIDTIATAIVAQLLRDPVTGWSRLRYSNAGHPPAVVVAADGTATLLDSHDLLLGLDDRELRTTHAVDLEPGATLLLFSDGLVERRGENLTVGLDRLLAVVRDARGLPVDELVGQVLARLVPEGPEDDVALVALVLDSAGAAG